MSGDLTGLCLYIRIKDAKIKMSQVEIILLNLSQDAREKLRQNSFEEMRQKRKK